MAFTEEAKKLIPSWLPETKISELHSQLGAAISTTEFASIVTASENWKRESKEKENGNIIRTLDCRPLNSGLKLRVVTDSQEKVISHTFVINASDAGVDNTNKKTKSNKKAYLFAIGRHVAEEQMEGTSPFYVNFTRRSYWEKNNCAQDGFSESEYERLEPIFEELGLAELSECTYEPCEIEITEQQLREDLLKAGFEEDAQFTQFLSFGLDADPEEIAIHSEAGSTGNFSDYYFNTIMTPDSLLTPFQILICPKKYFDAEGCLFDQHLSQDCGGPLFLGHKFEELQESIFGYDGTSQEAHNECVKLGLTHNPKLN